MNKSIIRYLLCRVIQFEGIFLLLPVIVAFIYGEYSGFYFAIVSAASLILGSLGTLKKPKSNVFYAREGFVTVSLSWLLLSLISAIPFTISGEIPSYLDAVFETASGFTTTGATILSDVEAMSMSSMFFRCFTNWIGGMGVLVFMMAILPLSGNSNMYLMKAESTGADVSKLVPKVKDSAKILYGMYLGLTGVLIVIYLILGEPVYDAFILAFSTMGTGGFGRYNASLGAYGYATQTVTIIFMFLCGINFNAFFLLLRRKAKEFFKLEEVWWYFGIMVFMVAGVTTQVYDKYANLREAVHHSAFQVVSIMTTTGFSTEDFELWSDFAKAVLLLAMFIGGCAGATAGGIKVSRLLILMRSVKKEIGHLTHPRSIRRIKLNGSAVSDETIKNIESFLIAYVLIFIISLTIVFADNFDFTTSFSAVLSMMGNVGPGLNKVGPTGNFGIFSPFSKIVLIFDMLAGRLELFPMLVLLYPATWRKS